ncbi:thiamine-phosphate kinase [Sphingomonas sanguinis]|jgi:thiamine-monophosphate kinase|uniref:Thiamine-monophosphate kinase n=1 Tax=Sphingomonas sanguinis TaxID=33051 RepID=A0A7Y7UT76_9SPHN|nr:thiamine-phosphate kinase [Sphingomonas sanguinis]MBZ6383226.1 thiamine-phosphate kinase [Sphingomonas sanguinis]NNG50086.1 thiamine-phosphate kinase [Sphingomonas sanguinis]NNG53577.1 thiamine-phosphate kinase [Sphingomonas sanguinis]NVP32521.1 thiamine-phosphate kinase [Sphingomonas sanguinis]
MTEAEFIAALRRMPLHPGARGLVDDSAVIDAGPLVVTTDTLVEGVHFLPDDPPADIAWKLVATNLSDLAAKGALVEGVLLNYPLGDSTWDRAFLDGLGTVLTCFDTRLIGGDTVSKRGPRTLTLTAFGRDAAAPSRDGAQDGDALWVTGTIGDAGLGLAIAQAGHGPVALRDAYRRPFPRLSEGRALGPIVHAMMDVSDGLLIDAHRMARASGLAVTVALDRVPLSEAARAFGGTDRAARLAAATAGDDYELLFALPAGIAPPVAATCVGSFGPGGGLILIDSGKPIPPPPRWGYEHAPER